MPNIHRDYVLQPGQVARPLLWIERRPTPHLPACDDAIMDAVMGGRNKAFRTWGHDEHGVHWLCTQRGVQMHTDPTYTRFTHHLVVRNDGWKLIGFDNGPVYPFLAPGTMLCLDTWSPHALVIDERVLRAKPRLKLALIVDATRPLTPDEAWKYLSPRLADADAGLKPDDHWAGQSKHVTPVA